MGSNHGSAGRRPSAPEMYIRQSGPDTYRQVLRDIRKKEIYKLIVDTDPSNIAYLFRSVSLCKMFVLFLCSFSNTLSLTDFTTPNERLPIPLFVHNICTDRIGIMQIDQIEIIYSSSISFRILNPLIWKISITTASISLPFDWLTLVR